LSKVTISNLSRLENAKLEALLSLLNEHSQPNINALTEAARNIPLSNLNFKMFGYDLARRLAEALPVDRDITARHVGLASKPSTQADIESAWLGHWCGQLHMPVVYHRKLWELSYVLQAIYENGHMQTGARGLGFGCGVEPLPSYLASRGVSITMTDLLPEEAQRAGWAATNQHTTGLKAAYQPHLVAEEAFDALVNLRYVDMNAIPSDLKDYDFCWSICAFEHLGSIDNGLNFIEQSLNSLRPGGLSVHTTEFNINSDGATIDNWATVLFQRKHFEGLAQRLRAKGHYVADFDFFLGDKPMDRFIDLPPYHHDLPQDMADWIGPPRHLKVGVDGFASTCFGLLVRKAG
jgi:hypothetical protein